MLGHQKPIRIVSFIVGSVLALLVIAGAWNGLRPLPTVNPSVSALPNIHYSATVAWPQTGEAAAGAVGYGLLATSGKQTPLPTASVTKVIVSLAVLEKLPLKPGEQGPTFTISDADVARYNSYVARDGSVVPVVAGETLTEYQALQALLLPSANNIADSLAVWAFGSVDNYFVYGNDMVKRLGMTHTTLAGDASGLSPLTVSTPEDLVKLGEAAMQNPVLAEIVGQKSAVLPVAGQVTNYNSMLGVNSIVGIKTGNSDEAGGCYLFAATHEVGGKPLTVVGAVMGVDSLGTALADGKWLAASLQSNFSAETPVHKGDVVATYRLPWGATVQAVAQSDVSVVHWNSTPITSKAEVHLIQGAKPQNAEVGTLTITAGKTLVSTKLVLKDAVAAPSIWWRITRRH